jgi:hypothetical protein
MQLQLIRTTRRRTAAVVAALGLIVAVASLLVGGSATAHRTKPVAPSLTLARRSPVLVSGHNFQPRSRVHLRLVAGQTLTRNATANRRGAFTARFSAVIDRCSSWSITASQRHHSAVVLRGPAKPECAPASTP